MINQGINLYDYQQEAVDKMKNGCILCGGVGSGKSITSIAYFFTRVCDGSISKKDYVPMKNPKDLYIITTARKRDTLEWEKDLSPFLLSPKNNFYSTKVIIDSWNNIGNYSKVMDSFFIFDEQRVVGSGAWTKAFLKIAKNNKWILLSATPGDCWMDYIPIFIANGFYKNRTEFIQRHVIYTPRVKFPKVDRYIEEGRLIRLRNSILVTMNFERQTKSHFENVIVDYDKILYKRIMGKRWNVFKEQPIKNASELCYALRRVVNSDNSRIEALKKICNRKDKLIVFYNFDYELDILRNINLNSKFEKAEWNGHLHEPIPKSNKWIYFVQYSSGAEGWNCIETDTIVFFSLNYSYKTMVQASGRIDRLNSPFKDLYYYRFKSNSPIDLAISRALSKKKNFNARSFVT